jgi:GNAT superfamily N-acetyltransferase
MGDLAAALAFKREHRLRAVERVEPVQELPGALAAQTPSLHHVYELNLVLAPADAPGERVADACARRGLPKARLDGDATGAGFPPGWDVERELVMVRRRPPDRAPGPDRVRPVGLAELDPSEEEFLRPALHAREPEIRRQLIAQHERWEAAAPAFQRLGIAEHGRVVAWCRVFDDGRLAEIDAVGVLPAERGRGLGRALMEGVLEHIPPGRTVFLVADEDDWPRRLYARLGFDAVGTCTGATRRRT